jgi:RNA recognition motif-containing protein
MARIIQVGNLPESVNSLALRRLFEAHGAVRGVVINRHFETGRSTGVGFVEMETAEGGTAAIAALNHREHFSCILSVCASGASAIPEAGHDSMFGPMNMTS